MYRSHFVHSLLDGNLNCFHILTTVNNACYEYGCTVTCLWVPAFNYFGYMSLSGIAMFYFFEELPYCFCWFSPTVQKDSRYSTSSPTSVILGGFLDSSHPNEFEVIFYCLIYISLMISDVKHLFFVVFCNWFWEGEKKKKKQHWFVPLFCAFIGWHLCVPWPGIQPATLVYCDTL